MALERTGPVVECFEGALGFGTSASRTSLISLLFSNAQSRTARKGGS